MRSFAVAVLIAAATAAAVTAGPAQAASRAPVTIDVLSNRADLVSGGDALVQVQRPAGATTAAVKVAINGSDVTSVFADSGGGRLVGLVKGMAVGPNELTATLPDGRGARITITNHPIGGPVFSGPQIQPWICNTQNPPANSGGSPTVVPVGLGPPEDAQCNTPPAVSYVYKSASSGQFETYDPDHPPDASAIATTTTDEGKTVRYVVRQEFGVQDRGIYAIAMLADAGGWNHKLVTLFGASTAPDHQQSQPSAVLDDMALSRGFMTANSSLNVNGQNTNQDVSAEALMMLKEHIVETYGQIRYTIGEGCSGGSYQQMVAAMYPGLLNGIQPNCSYTDIWTTAPDVFDCGLLIKYFEANGNQPWVPDIDGHKDPSDCAAWYALFYSMSDPTNADHCHLDADLVYDPKARPALARCTVQDYQEPIWGPRPESQWTDVEKKIHRGFTARPWGNAGVQYGLKALEAGSITPAEFVDINAKIGGLTIDHQPEAARSVVDETTAATAYRTGQVLDARQLRTVPIIDLRAYSETGEIHTSFYSYKTRARLDEANGTHANQLIWTFPAAEPILGVGPPANIALKSFLLMDQWLSRIEADKSSASLAQKVLRDRPADAVDTCYAQQASATPSPTPGNAPLVAITDPSQCASLYPHYGDTRTAAGGPMTDDIIQCQRKAFDPSDYKVTFSTDQLAQLRKTFADGVCDYSKPGVGEQPSQPWITFADGPGGKALGAPPASVPFGSAKPGACTRVRKVRIRIRRRGARVRSVTVHASGHRVRRLKGRRSSVRVGLVRRRTDSTVRVTLVVKGTRHGRKLTWKVRRTYRTCAKRVA